MSDSREKYQQRLSEARRAFEESTAAADAASRQVVDAASAVSDFNAANELRRDAAHAGVDQAVANAQAALPRKLLELRRRLCSGQQPADVTDLAALFVAGSPEFAATLHEMVDGPVPPGLMAWSDFPDQAGRDAALAELRAPLAAAKAAEQEVKEAQEAASKHLADLELGRG
jgi:hypothetical protein